MSCATVDPPVAFRAVSFLLQTLLWRYHLPLPGRAFPVGSWPPVWKRFIMTTIAFIGVGHIHTPGFINMLKKRTDTKVKYVFDQEKVRADQRASELGAKSVSDASVVWSDPEVSAVVICSETTRHQKDVEAAAGAKKHMFVEKPLGMGSADGYAMADAIEKAGVIFQTGYFMRGFSQNLFLKDLISKGAFGTITRVRGSNCHSGALGGWFDTKPNDPAGTWRWMADPKISGVGGFGDLGTHALDILIWLMGDVSLATAQIDNGTARYEGCDELGEGLMRFKNGAIGTLAAGWDDVANPVTLLVSGTEGHAAIINGQLHLTSKKLPQFDGSQPVRNSEMPAQLPHAFELYCDAINGNKSVPLVTAREAAYRSAVMEAMYEGAKNGTWVKPK